MTDYYSPYSQGGGMFGGGMMNPNFGAYGNGMMTAGGMPLAMYNVNPQGGWYQSGAPQGWINPNFRSFNIEGIGSVTQNRDDRNVSINPDLMNFGNNGGTSSQFQFQGFNPQGWSPQNWQATGYEGQGFQGQGFQGQGFQGQDWQGQGFQGTDWSGTPYSGQGNASYDFSQFDPTSGQFTATPFDGPGYTAGPDWNRQNNEWTQQAIDSNKPWFDEQAARGMSNAAVRFGKSGMMNSTPYMQALGDVQRNTLGDYNKLAMDYRYNAAESAINRDLQAYMDEQGRSHQGQLAEMGQNLGAWQTEQGLNAQGALQGQNNAYNAWALQNSTGADMAMNNANNEMQAWALQNQMGQNQNQFMNNLGFNNQQMMNNLGQGQNQFMNNLGFQNTQMMNDLGISNNQFMNNLGLNNNQFMNNLGFQNQQMLNQFGQNQNQFMNSANQNQNQFMNGMMFNQNQQANNLGYDAWALDQNMQQQNQMAQQQWMSMLLGNLFNYGP